MFGVSTRALAEWLGDGVPADRAPDVALLDQATVILLANVKVGRIPAVVRRPSASLGGSSLLDVAAAGDLARVVADLRETFDVHRHQP
jgi:hypothetical protein